MPSWHVRVLHGVGDVPLRDYVSRPNVFAAYLGKHETAGDMTVAQRAELGACTLDGAAHGTYRLPPSFIPAAQSTSGATQRPAGGGHIPERES